MRGRKPTSNEEKLAKGETRPSRVNYQEPEVPEADVLGAPKELKGAGFRMWRDYAKVMRDSGQLRATDIPLFIEHCKTQMDIEKWETEKVKKDLDRSTRLAIERILNQIKSRSLREAAELGMSSVSRSRVKTVTKPPVEKPKHERFFGKSGGIRGVIAGGRK